MSKTPTVSIILPTYNRGFTISRAIESVIGQTYTAWELLIIDDGSADATKNIIGTFLKSDPRISYHRQKNIGSVAARQKGLKHALGRVITFIDSDDYYLPKHLEINLELLKKNPQLDMILGKAKILGDRYVPDMTDLNKKIHLDKCALYGTFFLKNKIFKKIKKLPRSQIGADHLLHQLIIKYGFLTYKNTRRTYVYDRTLPDSVTKSFVRKRS